MTDSDTGAPPAAAPEEDTSMAGSASPDEELLIREGDIAGDYLERLLDIVDVDGDIDMDVEGDRAVVAIIGERLNSLVGRGGETLEALQELTRLAVIQQTGVRSRLMLDIGGFRARRRQELTELGTKAATDARESGEPVVLAPMTPFERKIVHDAVAAVDGVESESDGVERGLRGPREPDRIWDRHLLSSAVLAELMPARADVVDLGSGAGLPGIPLAIARPDLTVTLVEPMLRRARFLEEVVALLNLPVQVRRARAQELPRGTSQIVVARAVAPLRELLDLALPLLRPGGALLAIKGERAEAELAEAVDTLRRWPDVHVSLDSCGEGEHTVRVARIALPRPDQGVR